MKKKLPLIVLGLIICLNLMAQNCNPFVDTTSKEIVCKDSAQLFSAFSKINKINLSNNLLNSVCFINQNNGFVLNTDSLYRTVDGGASWIGEKIFNDPSSSDMSYPTVFFVGENIGYIIGAGGDSLIMKTTNGGSTWTKSNSANAYYYSMYFTSVDTGYVTGFLNWGIQFGWRMISKTTDGGVSWNSIYFQNEYGPLSSIYFTNSNIGFVAGAQGTILKTTNAGTTWVNLTSNVSSDLLSIYFVNQNTGFAVGNGGVILKTVDAGNNWIQLNSHTSDKLSSVYFTDENTGYIAGDKIILKTIDGGISWTPLFVDLAVDYKSIFFPNSLTGFAVGTNGTLLKITDIENATYSWEPTTGLNNANIANPVAKPATATSYKVTITPNLSSGCNNVYSDSVRVKYVPFSTPEICMVGTQFDKNIVIWNKPISSSIDSFFVWRESDITNVYDKIGATAYSDSSLFIDETSNPDIQSNRYKISILDECGMDSEKSNSSHKTMHLFINQGATSNIWNLIWDAYEGFAVNTYKIFRGTSKDNMALIGTTSGSGSTQYSDFTAPSEYVYYQVQVVSSNACNPSKLINTTCSNIATNNPNGVFENKSDHVISVFPNPTTGIVNINSLDNLSGINEVIVADMLGNIVCKVVCHNNTDIIDLSSLSNGVYTFTVSNSKNRSVEKIVIQK